MSRQALSALAYVVHELRPDWGKPGIQAALERAHQNTPDLRAVAHAAITATLRDDQRTPAIIALPGQHWDCQQRGATLPPRPRILTEPMPDPLPAETITRYTDRIRRNQ